MAPLDKFINWCERERGRINSPTISTLPPLPYMKLNELQHGVVASELLHVMKNNLFHILYFYCTIAKLMLIFLLNACTLLLQ